MKKLYCVIVDIDNEILNTYVSENNGDDSVFYKKDKHVGRIMVAKLIGIYENDEYEYSSPIGTFAVNMEEMNGERDVLVSEAIMRCFLNIDDAIALSKKLIPNPVMGRGINVELVNENKNTIRLTESQLHKVIKESVKRVLRETGINTDDPYHYAEYYNEDPRYEYYPKGKQGDIDYSWDEFNMRNGNMPFQQKNRHEIMDLKRKGREFQQSWTPRELRRAERQKQRYISGGDIDDFTQEYQH